MQRWYRPSVDVLAQRMLQGDRGALAKAISLGKQNMMQ